MKLKTNRTGEYVMKPKWLNLRVRKPNARWKPTTLKKEPKARWKPTTLKRTTKQESTTTTGIKHTSETQALIQNQETIKVKFQTHSKRAISKARMQASEGVTTNRAHHNAPYCITMQLTPDYGRRAKGKPEAPKAQTPHYCTGQRPCEQITHSTQRVQGSPFNNR